MYDVKVMTSEEHEIVFRTGRFPVAVYERPHGSTGDTDFVRVGDDSAGVIVPSHIFVCAVFEKEGNYDPLPSQFDTTGPTNISEHNIWSHPENI